MDELLGSELKKVRKSRQLTLQQLSDQSGLSVSFLSQIERGLRTLTFTSLKKICEALDVNVNFFFDNGDSSFVKKEKTSYKNTGNFSYKSLVGKMKHPDFIPAQIDLEAGEYQQIPYTHSGQEFVYVLSGQLEVEIEGVQETLYSNESIHIDSSMAHHWYNATDETTKLLLVSSTK